jgi:hypothetical protein
MVKIKLKFIFTVFALSLVATCLHPLVITFPSYSLKNINTKIFSIQQKREDKLVCIILTIEKHFETRSLPSWNTWAKKCDKTLFACNCSNFQKNKS